MAPIQKAIDNWRPLLIRGKTAPEGSDPAQALRGLIWEPVERHLDGITSVLVSPDGALGQVPLAALPGKDPSRYLIEERSIAVVPVPRMLGSTAATAVQGQGGGAGPGNPAPSLLLAGDVDYGGDPGAGADRGASRSAAVPTRAGFFGHFGRLPATGDEIASIGRYFRTCFRGAKTLELAGKEATEEAFRSAAPRCRYLHMATHAYFAPAELRSALGPENPQGARPGIDALEGAGVVGYDPGLLSGIVLAGANRRPTPTDKDDGILTALEVAELDLTDVELVVLSACETGLGEVAGGEGLLGLQRAFQVADAETVVASLWSVNDDATGLLITEFYRNLWERKLSKGEALRQAQLKMLRGELRPGESRPEGARGLRRPDAPRDYRKPYYWAPFVLSGDWR
jgi:CHAT domain-containing protein